jgi:hypothetical protein
VHARMRDQDAVFVAQRLLAHISSTDYADSINHSV